MGALRLLPWARHTREGASTAYAMRTACTLKDGLKVEKERLRVEFHTSHFCQNRYFQEAQRILRK